jgi:outer membrane protein OmpA-like peptidoglycan-associated protein
MRLLLTGFIVLSFFAFRQTAPVFKFSDAEFEVGSLMTRRNIGFTDDCRTRLKPSKTLDSVVTLLKDHLNLKMEIGVHAGKPCLKCGTCSPTQNAADAILAYLVKKGIDKKRLLAKGYGMANPLLKDANNQARQDAKAWKTNERVEFKITYNKF